MHILYNLATLDVECVMYDCHEFTAAHNRTLPNHVEHPESIPHHEIHLEPHPTEAGKVVVSRKRAMAATLSAPTAKIAQSIVVADVPEGAEIRAGDDLLGVMDESGSIEFAAEVAGFYKLRLVKRGFHTQEFDVEIVAG